MTNDQGAKSQSNPNDQAPNPKGRKIAADALFWNLVIRVWDLLGIWAIGHWDFGPEPARHRPNSSFPLPWADNNLGAKVTEVTICRTMNRIVRF
jgi:hypothetical protein